MAQQNKVGSVHTSVFIEDGIRKVVYHNTVVAKWDDKTITLNTGGYETATTKTRMNQASNQYELGFHVYQHQGTWFVDHNGTTHEFTGNIVKLDRQS